LRLGFTAFGGPAAHIAMMEQEFVSRKKLLTREKFLDLVAMANLIPGPSSSETAIYIGQLLAGVPGLIIAGVCFIFPASAIVLLIARFYSSYGALPQVDKIFYGIKPVVIAILIQALSQLGKTAVKNKSLAWIGVLGLILNALGVSAILILLIAGILSALVQNRARPLGVGTSMAILFLSLPAFAMSIEPIKPTLDKIFLFFLKIGSVQFGSGYVLLAFLREDLVTRWHWLTDAQLLDAIAVGQFTPGPVFTTATFIGYLLNGISGAAVATLGIFLPAFILVPLSAPLIFFLRKSITASAFLDGVVVASLALMIYVSISMSRNALIDWESCCICLGCAFLLFKFRLNSAWLVVGGACLGYLKYVFAHSKCSWHF
jgi:chromate transporter